MNQAYDFSSADLEGANLHALDLSGANLSSANLSAANLRGAILTQADLSATNLRGAQISMADLCHANLISADFVKELAQAPPYREPVVSYSSTNQLLAAAVVSRRFRHLLLTNPAQAIAEGWNGKKFVFSSKERQRLMEIKARTLDEFALQLIVSL